MGLESQVPCIPALYPAKPWNLKTATGPRHDPVDRPLEGMPNRCCLWRYGKPPCMGYCNARRALVRQQRFGWLHMAPIRICMLSDRKNDNETCGSQLSRKQNVVPSPGDNRRNFAQSHIKPHCQGLAYELIQGVT